jgi:hypothetical protein
MPETPEPSSIEPARLTITYTENEDGWVTAQVVEYPAAISQGRTQDEAWLNVLDALHDLTHEPTLAERIAFAIEAGLAELGEFVGELGELGNRLIGAAAERRRDVADRGRTSLR